MSNYTLVSCVESVMIEPTELYGRFALGNFTKGQSLTVANALRRCLLSQLIGCAICFVEIRGITHEYESLPGMKESVLDVLFNLRQVTLKSEKTLFNSQLAYLNVLGPGVVRARDLKLPYFISAIDPNHYIATLSPNSKLVMKLIINCGKTYLKHTPASFDYNNHISKLKQRSWFKVGYQPQNNLAYSSQWTKERPALLKTIEPTNQSETDKRSNVSKPAKSDSKSSKRASLNLSLSQRVFQKANTLVLPRSFKDPLADHLEEGFNKQKKVSGFVEPLGYFPIDAVFAPILKANYTVESVSPTKEKIYFEIWTNGSMDPRQAIHKASKALIELFLPLQGFQMLTSKAKSLTHFKPSFTLNREDPYPFKRKSKLKPKLKANFNLNEIKKRKLDISSTKQSEVETFIYWLKTYVKNHPKLTLKIVKAVLKPKMYVVDVKFGVIRQNLVRPINSRSATEKLLRMENPLREHRLEERIIVKAKAQSKEIRLKRSLSPFFNRDYIDMEPHLTKKQRLNKQRLEDQNQQQKKTLQKSVVYFKHLMLNVDLSQVNLPYNVYLGLKTNEIHNIEQLINVSSAQLKTMLKLNSKHIKVIQVTLKNYVLEHLTN